MLSINTNLSSIIAQHSMSTATAKLNQAIERMTTGYKINHAKDNAANYSIATNLTTKLGAYDVAADNVAMGMDLITTASDTLSLMQDKAERLRTLCIQARNNTYGAQSLAAINTEANAIMAEINRIYSTAQYNGVSLYTGATATANATPEVAMFAMQRTTEPEMSTFAMQRSTTSESKFIEEIEQRDTTSMVTMTQLVNGTTSATKEYSISTKEELVALANYVNNTANDTTGMTFVLGADIDLSSISNWTPIGDYSKNTSYEFKGTFDGNGHVIKNLTINRSVDYQGLFGRTASGSVIKNVGIEGGSVRGKNRVGGLVGNASSSSSSSISNSYATGNVSGSSYVGGLVGTTSSSSINNSYATGNVTGSGNSVGGLAGYSFSSISNSYATGTVSGTTSVGGLVGNASSISNSYATGNVTGSGHAVGGLAGASTSISNSYATGTVSGDDQVGGLVGNAASSSSISNSYATGTVSGGDQVGGLVGYASYSTSINNSYATGTVSGSSYVGGLVGTTSSITNCAATQTDSKATLMTEEEIKSTSNLESMGFTEANGWTIVDGAPLQSWQKEAQGGGTGGTDPDPTPGGGAGGTDPDPTPGGGSGGTDPDPTPGGGNGGTDPDSGSGTGGGSGGSTPGGGNSGAGATSPVGVSSFSLQIGINGDSSCQIGFDTNFSYDLSIVGADITSDEALATIDEFLNLLSEKQTQLGAVQNRLESALESIMVNIENLTSSLSTIRDADIAEVSSEYIKMQILQQASSTLLATANQTPSIALQLI